MSKNFGTVPRTLYIDPAGPGQRLSSLNIALCVPTRVRADIGAKAVPIVIDWSRYGVGTLMPRLGVDINLTAQQTERPLDYIRSVYIDNSFSDFPVFVQFPDTKFTVICPPQAVGLFPVVTNLWAATIYGEGFFNGVLPVTSLQFMNVEVDGIVAETLYNDPVTLQNASIFVSALAAQSTVTLPVPLGVATPDRLMAFAVSVFDDLNTLPLTILSASLDGIACNAIAQAPLSGAVPAMTSTILLVFRVLGAVGNLTVNFSRAVTGFLWGVSYAMSNASVVLDSTAVATFPASTISSSMRVVPGMAQIYMAGIRGDPDIEYNWHNVEINNNSYFLGSGGASQARFGVAAKIATRTGFDTIAVRSHTLLGVVII